MPGPLLPPLLAVPTAAGAAAAAANAAHAAAVHVAPRVGGAAASGAVAAVLAKEAWRRLPAWVREDPAFRSYSRAGGRRDSGVGDGASEDENEMAHLTSSLRKLGDWLESGAEALGKSRLTRAQLHAAMLAFVQLSVQLRSRRPEVRDGLYRPLSDSHAPSKKELEELREMLDYAVWSYVDFFGAEAVRKELSGRGYELLSHAPSNVPGRVGHFVAISKERNTLLIGVKGTSTMEDLLTDAAGKAVDCPVGVSDDEGDGCGLDVSVEVDPDFIDVIAEFDAVEVTRGEAIFVARDGTEIRCHEGVLLSSRRRLCDAVLPTIERHAVRGECSVIVCGHSLGGASAALLAVLLRSRLPVLAERDAVRAVAFGPPPAVDSDAAASCAGYVTSVVNNSDFIPRCSVANLAVLLEVLAEVSDRLKERGMGLEGPKRAAAFLKHLSGGAQRAEMIMSCEEYGAAVARAHRSVEVRDPDHLYVPGKMVLLYEPWMMDDCYAEKVAEVGGGGKDGAAIHHRSVCAAVAFGTAPPLRFLEIGGGGNAFMDHLTTAYEAALDSLLQRNPSGG